MLELMQQQHCVGDALREGSRLVGEGRLNKSVSGQMKLVNNKWESLRLQSMEHQGK